MFTNPIPKPKASETWTGVGKPEVSETYLKVPRIVQTWIKVELLTAPAKNEADIAETDIAILQE